MTPRERKCYRGRARVGVMKLIKLQITATETHCGMFGTAGQLRCRYVMPYGGQPVCAVFPARELKYDDKAGEFFRLPECVKAGDSR